MMTNPLWFERHHLFGLAGEGQAKTISRILGNRGGRMLDIGCGPQWRHIKNLSYHCENLIAADHNEGVLRQATGGPSLSNVTFVLAEAVDLPFARASLDNIIALGLFTYLVGHLDEVFQEFRRVIRPGGKVFLTNSVANPKEPVLSTATSKGFALTFEDESFCPSASGPIPKRYLLILTAV